MAIGPVKGHLLVQTVITRAAQPTSARAIATEVASVLKPLNKGERFVSEALLAAWPEIVGARLAGLCLPTRLRQAPKSRSKKRGSSTNDGAVLEVLADHAVAIDLDYGQALLIERINAFYGYQAVSTLKVRRRQRPTSTQPASSAQPVGIAAAPSTADKAEASARTAGVEEPALRAALEALGANIAREKRRRER